jgi:S-adenosylmethionine:tRNA ribosyltransferase-isomerase
MKLNEFNYVLPESLIAQTPLAKRDESRLMLLNRVSGEINHQKFFEIINYLNKGDILVRNITKVIPARLFGIKQETGAAIEILLLNNIKENKWECLVGNSRTVKLGTIVKMSNRLSAKCVEVKDEGIRIFEMFYEGLFLEILDELGETPLPPYIKTRLSDKDRYQTVYAKEPGSAAAPTAGFHFTNELFEKLKLKGIKVLDLTLHVGLGTFRPMKVEIIEEHKMHAEYYNISENTAIELNRAKKNGNRIIAIGTTSARTLEHIVHKFNEFRPDSGFTDIFIYPGFKFMAIDGLITNFHLPKSSLLLLVSAFSSKEIILKAYNEAINNKYRFFSFGDAMFIY